MENCNDESVSIIEQKIIDFDSLRYKRNRASIIHSFNAVTIGQKVGTKAKKKVSYKIMNPRGIKFPC